jgi:DNA-directed RNA polymerase specialized sigma24 family protein
MALPGAELIRRASVPNDSDPDFLRSESILYLIRQRRLDHDQRAFRALYEELRRRVRRALPRPDWGKANTSARLEEIQQHVLDRFNKHLCEDRVEYSTKLDYFECRFNDAVAALRMIASRDVRRRRGPLLGLSDESDSPSQNSEVEEALARFRGTSEDDIRDKIFRLSALEVIGELPDDQRRVMEMLLADMPIDSKDPTVVTIASVLKCDEKTVRNRRDRAIRTIQTVMRGEASQ